MNSSEFYRRDQNAPANPTAGDADRAVSRSELRPCPSCGIKTTGGNEHDSCASIRKEHELRRRRAMPDPRDDGYSKGGVK